MAPTAARDAVAWGGTGGRRAQASRRAAPESGPTFTQMGKPNGERPQTHCRGLMGPKCLQLRLTPEVYQLTTKGSDVRLTGCLQDERTVSGVDMPTGEHMQCNCNVRELISNRHAELNTDESSPVAVRVVQTHRPSIRTRRDLRLPTSLHTEVPLQIFRQSPLAGRSGTSRYSWE
ncbi:hypothetical protein DHEL01_v210161 [Diaporthe helianthi]|uniref:Uncharacterized protein n=1 Tax=Diaporthe helianthi TaxID=158607 RepID=A0A2P5HMG1_DIAHE|nr:hypothetical protein DHEL01_v210161 [Diaporthe helianthi]